MKADEQQKTTHRMLWTAAFFLHALLVWIGLEVFGDNYLWVMDPRQPWIKDRITPPLTTVMALPGGLLCAGTVCLLAYITGRLIGDRGFGIGRYLAFAFTITFLLALATGNFVVLTGPFGVRADNWYIRPLAERLTLAAGVTLAIVAFEGSTLWGLTRLGIRGRGPTPAVSSKA